MTDTSADSATQQGKQAASNVKDDAQGKASDVAAGAKREARTVAADAKEQASEVVGTARDELRGQAAEQTKTLSSTLDDFGRQLSSMADSSEVPQAQVAQLARSAADQLSSQAERLDSGGFDGLIDDTKRFARNRPGAFLLGSVVAGFAIGRLAKHADLKQAGQHAKETVDNSGASGSNETTSTAPSGPDTTAGRAATTGTGRGLQSPTAAGVADTAIPATEPR